MVWFDGELDGYDWVANNCIANIDDPDIDDEYIDMYMDRSLDECPMCGNLYAKGCVEYYTAIGGKLCKACFREAALEDISWMN